MALTSLNPMYSLTLLVKASLWVEWCAQAVWTLAACFCCINYPDGMLLIL